MNEEKIKLDNRKLNKLINHANALIKMLYFLFIIGIILAAITVLKELKFFNLIANILSVLLPVIIGFVIAWLLNPIVLKIEEKKIPKIVATLIVYIVALFFTFIFFRVFIPVLYKQINDLIKMFPNIYNSISSTLDRITNKFLNDGIDLTSAKENILLGINNYASTLSRNIPSYLIDITKSFFSVIGIILMGLVIGIYMILDYDNIYNKCVSLFPKKWCLEISNLTNRIGEEVRKTVNGTLLVALMVLVFDSILFAIIGLESPLLFGVLCGLTDLIPFIGPYIGGAAATIVAFTQSSTIGFCILISCALVQIVENYILQPIVMSKATKVNPIIVIMFLLVFGHFFGITGMIFATPLLAVIKVIYDYIKSKIINT